MRSGALATLTSQVLVYASSYRIYYMSNLTHLDDNRISV